MRGINWFGFETENANLMCLWKNPLEWHLDTMKNLGFDSIRLPFSLDYIKSNNWYAMDEFFDKSEDFDIILDFHRLENYKQSEKPFNNKYNFEDFLIGWQTILDRYEHYDHLVGIDIFNEYQSNNIDEWEDLAIQTVDFIREQYGERFDIIVNGYSWGSCLRDFEIDRENITYSIHLYPFHIHDWENCLNDKENLNIGEFGFLDNQIGWGYTFIDWLKKKNITDAFFWTWSPNSHDTGGILRDDCETINYNKMDVLNKLWY